MKEVVCKRCATWVDCGEKEGKPYGFCLQKDSFTYTAETDCYIFLEGEPMSEAEYEYYNKGVK